MLSVYSLTFRVASRTANRLRSRGERRRGTAEASERSFFWRVADVVSMVGCAMLCVYLLGYCSLAMVVQELLVGRYYSMWLLILVSLHGSFAPTRAAWSCDWV